MNNIQLHHGDCLEELKKLPDNYVDSVVTDPPYGLSFMGKKWDYDVPSEDIWRECLRVLKPGGHLLAFAGTRTQHRMAVRIEDAGFEIRDMIAWVYGSGFPKSLNIGKAVNSLETNEWSKISKAFDNVDQKSIMEVWKTNAKLAGIKLVKNLTGVGSNTRKKYFVHDIAVLYFNQEKENASAITAELNLCVPSRTSEENLSIAVGSVEQNTELSQNLVKSVVKLSENQRAKSWNIFTAQCDVKEWLNENTEVNHKVDEALKTLRGNKKYSNEEIINVLCVALTDILKLTILNQSKTFQNLDTNQKMECVSAINVIITEYIMDNLISNTVAILKSKAVDKLQGNEREVVGTVRGVRGADGTGHENAMPGKATGVKQVSIDLPLTKGTSPHEGWGTALKPALEPITVARKPLIGTVAENVLTHGTGGLNIDGCRVASDDDLTQRYNSSFQEGNSQFVSETATGSGKRMEIKAPAGATLGRFPANLIHDGSEEVVGLFPTTAPSKRSERGARPRSQAVVGDRSYMELSLEPRGFDDNGGSAARFFYCAKASKKDRGEDNRHPTVKPTDLMRYLCRLVTPPGGIVLDPFMGSGSTGKAAVKEGFSFIGIEREAEYVEIAKARIQHE